MAIVAFLGFFREPGSLVAPSPVLSDGLNFSDYPIMKVNEEPGLFPNMLLIPGGAHHYRLLQGLGRCRWRLSPE